MKIVFNIYGTWHWETIEKLMMKIHDFFIWPSRLVTPYDIVQKSLRRWKIFYTILYGVTKRLSRIKKIIHFHHQFFKRYPMPSAINVKNHFHISDLDSYCTQEHDCNFYIIEWSVSKFGRNPLGSPTEGRKKSEYLCSNKAMTKKCLQV